MGCITAQTSTLVFAVFNIILVTLSTAGCVGLFIFFVTTAFIRPKYYNFDRMENDMTVILSHIMAWLAMSLLCLVFSSFLLNGIIKKNPNHMKAYFVFGVIIMVISVFAFLLITFAVGLPMNIIITTIVVFVIYSSLLHLIRYTYTQIQTDHEQFDHQKLIENAKC